MLFKTPPQKKKIRKEREIRQREKEKSRGGNE